MNRLAAKNVKNGIKIKFVVKDDTMMLKIKSATAKTQNSMSNGFSKQHSILGIDWNTCTNLTISSNFIAFQTFFPSQRSVDDPGGFTSIVCFSVAIGVLGDPVEIYLFDFRGVVFKGCCRSLCFKQVFPTLGGPSGIHCIIRRLRDSYSF